LSAGAQQERGGERDGREQSGADEDRFGVRNGLGAAESDDESGSERLPIEAANV
jgi:hypothetical protein